MFSSEILSFYTFCAFSSLPCTSQVLLTGVSSLVMNSRGGSMVLMSHYPFPRLNLTLFVLRVLSEHLLLLFFVHLLMIM